MLSRKREKESLKIAGFHRHNILELPGGYVSLTWTTHVRKEIGFEIFRQRLDEGRMLGRHDQIRDDYITRECLEGTQADTASQSPTNIIAVDFINPTQQNAV